MFTLVNIVYTGFLRRVCLLCYNRGHVYNTFGKRVTFSHPEWCGAKRFRFPRLCFECFKEPTFVTSFQRPATIKPSQNFVSTNAAAEIHKYKTSLCRMTAQRGGHMSPTLICSHRLYLLTKCHKTCSLICLCGFHFDRSHVPGSSLCTRGSDKGIKKKHTRGDSSE